MSLISPRNYVMVLSAFAISLGVSWVYWYGLQFAYGSLVGAGVVAGLFLLSEFFSIRIGKHTEIDASDIILALAIILLGPVWAAIATIPHSIFLGWEDRLRFFYQSAQHTIGIFLSSMVFVYFSGPLWINEPASLVSTIYAAFSVPLILIATNFVSSAFLLQVKYGQDLWTSWKNLLEPYITSDAISVLTVVCASLAFVSYGLPATLVVATGSIVSQALVFRSREQVSRIGELEGRVRSLEESLMVSSRMFGDITIRELGRRDGYTHQHAVATAVYAEDMAREMGLGEDRIERLRLASLLHNIGLFEVPEEVLLARGKLNSLAWESIRNHPIAGEKALANVPEFGEISTWVRWHHERVDGRGYPDKLRGPWIPPEARIISVAQAYAAMVLDQPRRPGLGYEKAREELQGGIDSQFDGDAVRALIRLLETDSPGYRHADDYRFVLPVPDERPQPALHTPDEPEPEDIEDFRGGSRRL